MVLRPSTTPEIREIPNNLDSGSAAYPTLGAQHMASTLSYTTLHQIKTNQHRMYNFLIQYCPLSRQWATLAHLPPTPSQPPAETQLTPNRRPTDYSCKGYWSWLTILGKWEIVQFPNYASGEFHMHSASQAKAYILPILFLNAAGRGCLNDNQSSLKGRRRTKNHMIQPWSIAVQKSD